MLNENSISVERNSFSNKNSEKPSPFLMASKVFRKSSENSLVDQKISCKVRKYSDNKTTNVNLLNVLILVKKQSK